MNSMGRKDGIASRRESAKIPFNAVSGQDEQAGPRYSKASLLLMCQVFLGGCALNLAVPFMFLRRGLNPLLLLTLSVLLALVVSSVWGIFEARRRVDARWSPFLGAVQVAVAAVGLGSSIVSAALVGYGCDLFVLQIGFCLIGGGGVYLSKANWPVERPAK